MSTHTGSLYLSPRDARAEPPPAAQLLAVLQQLEIIGTAHGDNHWLAGDGLLRHITFAGCSPHLDFVPPADGSQDFCHVSLSGPHGQPRMYTGNNTLKPRCPSCKTRAEDWQPMAKAYARDPSAPWACPSCGEASAIEDWRWRQHAAFGRLLIQVHSVFGGEGVPSDSLLDALEKATGVVWTYGWAGSSN